MGEQILKDKKLLAKELTGPFIEENNITYLGREGDDYRLKMEGDKKHLNAFGMYHGGILFTLADTAAGLLMIDDGITAVTMQSNVNFVGNINGGPLYTHTRYIHKGTTTYVVEAEVRSDEWTLLLIGTFTFYASKALKIVDL